MTLADHTYIYNPTSKHVIFMYDEKKGLFETIANFLNEGLKLNQLCVFASVNLTDDLEQQVSQLIIDYKKNIDAGNLLVMDMKSFFGPIQEHDMAPFDELKITLHEKTKDRKDKHVRIFGDLASFLFTNKQFEECMMIEQWWQKVDLDVTCACPYQNSIFQNSPHKEKEEQIVSSHENIIYC